MIPSKSMLLNGICPYFTMFPLDFPLGILSSHAQKHDCVIDPFCGRGTTNFASRLLGLKSFGIDSSPVAVAITAAKLVTTTVDEILTEARRILRSNMNAQPPVGEFWSWAYHPNVLRQLCRFRSSFLADCSTPARIALRGILLGALHGPRLKTTRSYFSNQCPRTYAPKPAYSVRFWQKNKLIPEEVNVSAIIEKRAKRYYELLPETTGSVNLADSRNIESFQFDKREDRFKWVITSPPYYGMRSYIPDQWLRNWFVGGPSTVDYRKDGQVVHSSPNEFADDLRRVWRNILDVCTDDAFMVIRFGGITDRRADPLTLIRSSLDGSGWHVEAIHDAGTAKEGKRQADAFLRKRTEPMAEYDVWAFKEA